jgi:type II secretory pathway component PulF
MPIFQYTGTTTDGKTERGMVHGDSLESVAKRLEEKGVRVEQLGVAQSAADPLSTSAVASMGNAYRAPYTMDVASNKVSLEELQFFFTQFGTMLNAGISAADALNTLSNQARTARFREVLRETRDLAIEGKPVSEGFSRHPEVFSQLMMAMVRAGERGGFLAEQCRHMAEYLRRDIELRNMIRKETAYPKIVVAFSIVVILFANTVIEIFGNEGAQKIWSPLTSPVTWIVLGPVLFFLWYYFKVVKKRPEAQYKWDKNILTIPYVGPTSHGFAMAKFGRSFGALYRAGVPVGEAIKLAADACGNQFVRSQVYPAAQALDEGEGITNAFSRTGAFSPIVLDMTRTGEVTGDVDAMLIKVSEFYEEEGAVRARQAAMVFGVAVFVLVAAYVFYVVWRFYVERAAGIFNAAEG